MSERNLPEITRIRKTPLRGKLALYSERDTYSIPPHKRNGNGSKYDPVMEAKRHALKKALAA